MLHHVPNTKAFESLLCNMNECYMESGKNVDTPTQIKLLGLMTDIAIKLEEKNTQNRRERRRMMRKGETNSLSLGYYNHMVKELSEIREINHQKKGISTPRYTNPQML